MKTVGKQLQEARLAKNWTPELAARETKIKAERVRDLEADDYSNFTSPTYARGFVRTYARALGLDEYRILRQLDNKLPDDDSANLVTETGVAYLPETALPPRAAHRDYTGLYVVMGLGGVVTLVIAVVLFQAYRVGELSTWFANNSETPPGTAAVGTNTATSPANPGTDTAARALPVDSNVPPPIVDATAAPAPTNAPATVANIPGVSPRALPVDLSLLGAAPGTNAPPVTSDAPQAMRALPVDPSELTNAPAVASISPPADAPATPTPAPSDNPPAAPRALPVDPSELTNAPAPAPDQGTLVAANTAGSTAVTTPTPAPAAQPPVSTGSPRQPNGGPVMEPSLPAVEPAAASPPPATPAPAPVSVPAPAPTTPSDPAPQIAGDAGPDKRLVLTASQDSFVSVTEIDQPDAAKPLYASVLHSGQSVGFDGKKFSINVGVPSAVDIKLDGVNYGPHSDQDAPETFTVQSHLP
jgi:cytoskeleton protein RodZ